MLPVSEWLEIDRYALIITRNLQQEVQADYERYEFLRVAQSLQTFCSKDLGAFYLNMLKDRLYTTAEKSHARRSAQSALWHITQSLTRLMAPILAFTAEEIWQTLTHDAEDSVMLQTWHALPDVPDEAAIQSRWEEIRDMRTLILIELEKLRTEGKIGPDLQAAITILIPESIQFDALAALGEELKFVFISSAATVVQGDPLELTKDESREYACLVLTHSREVYEGFQVSDYGNRSEFVAVKVVPAPGKKCERCWHVREDVGENAEHPTICGRCVSNLFGEGEKRRHA
jgi:isoleucyl-tRNA synthetase